MSGANSDIPKIQLESKEDVLFLQQQLTTFLDQTLSSNAALRDAPFSEEQRSEAQKLVLERLQQWTQNMWGLAGPSMAVNGFAYDEAMSEKSRIEPLDEPLKAEVEALREEADALLLSVTSKRRAVPDQIERLVADAVWRESLAAEHTTAIKGLSAEEEEEEDQPLPYVSERVNAEFEHALGLAQKVRAEAPKTAAKLRELAETVKDTRERLAHDHEDDLRVRRVLVDQPAQANASVDAHLLAHKAALHAITAD
ncbi:hypothetical protein GGF44_006492 [Coemansia sp. RSA 1694]|nr:hypothetical protein GGF38_002922 [Coemansia sp. RSA 25]KAJ2485567.1 hypothetical protein IWW47_005555 [Coemansia sp. RSA 2052]KAJ2607310.1 hypothetical protein GGF44_006492 [Coemansia sp. RSA 1694]